MFDKSLFELPGIKKVLCILAGFAALRAFLIIGQAWSLSSALTALWYGGVVMDQTLWLVIFLGCFIGRQLVFYVQENYLDRYAYEQTDAMRQEALRKIFSSGTDVVQKQGTGQVTTTILEGIEQVETYIRLILPKMTSLIVVPLILLIFTFILDWVSGAIMFIVFPAIILYMIILGYTAKDKAAKQHKGFQIMSNHFIDSLRGIDTLKLFGRSKDYSESIFEVSERFRKATMRTLKVAILSGLALDMFSTLSIAAVAIMLGLRLFDGTLLLFPALTILVVAPEYFRPIRDFAADYHASLDGKNALMSVRALIDTPEEEVVQEPLALWDKDSSLVVEGLDVSYPDYQALDRVSLRAEGFQKIGIVGVSGAGKSTLVNTLGGFCLPDEGSISLQTTSVDSFRQHDWQKQVIYIPQNPYIFHASLRNNLSFYCPDAGEEELAEAVRIAGLESLIEELPQGIETKIGEGARSLSGGQAQRIALARAFLDKTRKVLLFDEPTAHLDIETEMELKERMLPLMQNRLVFFATHRLHWMENMDSILVMEDGKIAEQGTLEELRSQQGGFTKLISQMNRGGL